MASHAHGEFPYNNFAARAGDAGGGTGEDWDYTANEMTGTDIDWIKAVEKERGNNVPHNNIQPSIITHVWERIG